MTKGIIVLDLPVADLILLKKESLEALVKDCKQKDDILKAYQAIIDYVSLQMCLASGATFTPKQDQYEDLKLLINDFQKLCEQHNIDGIVKAPGGNGFNKIHHMKLQLTHMGVFVNNLPISIFGYVGNDIEGRELESKIEEYGFALEHIGITSKSTKSSFIIPLDGDRICIKNPNFQEQQDFFRSVDKAVQGHDFVDISYKSIKHMVEQEMEVFLSSIPKDAIVSYTPPAEKIEMTAAQKLLIKRVNVLTLNVEEARSLLQDNSIDIEDPDSVLKHGDIFLDGIDNNRKLLVLTDGRKGALALNGSISCYNPANVLDPSEIENTVGAGDSFAGVVMAHCFDLFSRDVEFNADNLAAMLKDAASIACVVIRQSSAQIADGNIFKAAVSGNVPTSGYATTLSSDRVNNQSQSQSQSK